jgi:anti-sigma B factor antagonist
MDGQEGRLEWPVVIFPAEIDMINAGSIGEELRSAFEAGARTVVADLTQTTFCDSSGVHMLARAHKQAAGLNIELRLAVPSRAVLRLFALTGLDRLLPIYPSIGSALSEGPVLDGPAWAGSP